MITKKDRNLTVRQLITTKIYNCCTISMIFPIFQICEYPCVNKEVTCKCKCKHTVHRYPHTYAFNYK